MERSAGPREQPGADAIITTTAHPKRHSLRISDPLSSHRYRQVARATDPRT